MKPLDLASIVAAGRRVVITRGVHKGAHGIVIKRLTPDDAPSCDLITGRCRYALDIGSRDGFGNVNEADYCRFEFRVIANERKPKRPRLRCGV